MCLNAAQLRCALAALTWAHSVRDSWASFRTVLPTRTAPVSYRFRPPFSDVEYECPAVAASGWVGAEEERLPVRSQALDATQFPTIPFVVVKELWRVRETPIATLGLQGLNDPAQGEVVGVTVDLRLLAPGPGKKKPVDLVLRYDHVEIRRERRNPPVVVSDLKMCPGEFLSALLALLRQ